jgi:D-threo-aldose 1-dehydrogenase
MASPKASASASRAPIATRKLGRTGVPVTQLGFGTAPLGDLFVKLSDEDAAATLQAAWDAGVRYVDTAPWYGRGQSEHRVGRDLYRRPRDQFVISTKVGRTLRPPLNPARFESGLWAGGLPFDVTFDYGYDAIMRSYEDSQQRLGMTDIDLLIIHDLDFMYHRTEAKVAAHLAQLSTGGFRALASLRDQGLIKGIGAGINELGMIPRFLDLFDMDFFLIAMRYTLLEQATLDLELPRCAERNVGIVIGGVFNSGILASGAVPGAKYNYEDATPEMMAHVRRVEAVCKRHKVPLAAAALQFPLGHPSVAAVFPGAIAPTQVQQNLAAMNVPIPADLWAELKHEKLLRADAPVPGGRAASKR